MDFPLRHRIEQKLPGPQRDGHEARAMADVVGGWSIKNHDLVLDRDLGFCHLRKRNDAALRKSCVAGAAVSACAADAVNFFMKALMPSLPDAAGRFAGVGALRFSRGKSVVSGVEDSISSVENILRVIIFSLVWGAKKISGRARVLPGRCLEETWGLDLAAVNGSVVLAAGLVFFRDQVHGLTFCGEGNKHGRHFSPFLELRIKVKNERQCQSLPWRANRLGSWRGV